MNCNQEIQQAFTDSVQISGGLVTWTILCLANIQETTSEAPNNI